ncbi:gag-pol polyprotein [Hordeum vulgare]|nr:gag-pol polyprotein [Hordeum vulgare]
MKFHFTMGLNNDIAGTIFTKNYKSLDDLYFGALKAEQELKAKATLPRAHFVGTKLHDYEHEDGTTKLSKPDELHDDAPKSDFTAIPLCSIDMLSIP